MVSVLFCDRGSFGVNSALQVEIGNVELEPESVEQDSGIEDARGIDRLESRYAGVKPFLCSSVSGCSFHSSRWTVGNQGAPPQNFVSIGISHSRTLTLFAPYFRQQRIERSRFGEQGQWG